MANGDEVTLDNERATIDSAGLDSPRPGGGLRGRLARRRPYQRRRSGQWCRRRHTPLRGIEQNRSCARPAARIRVASTDHHNVLEVERQAIDEVVRHDTLAAFAADPGLSARNRLSPSIYHRAQSVQVSPGA